MKFWFAWDCPSDNTESPGQTGTGLCGHPGQTGTGLCGHPAVVAPYKGNSSVNKFMPGNKANPPTWKRQQSTSAKEKPQTTQWRKLLTLFNQDFSNLFDLGAPFVFNILRTSLGSPLFVLWGKIASFSILKCTLLPYIISLIHDSRNN